MCDPGSGDPESDCVTSVTGIGRYGDWCFEQRIVSQLGPDGTALESRTFAAHEALRVSLGSAGFDLLDAYVSASMAVANAREEAIFVICRGLERKTRRA